MSTTYFTADHEFLKVEGDIAVVGITDYAQEQLGDIVFVELPSTGKAIEKGATLATVESVKAASEVYAPVSGEVVEVNAALEEAPGTVNADPQGAGWFVKLRLTNKEELASLLDACAYDAHLKTL
ncbi:MAG TPA: glycine cleavage system protein GcvH [Methylocystis sp.]|nr:glycine cleavage system protein GcvH [Methylocystis sp.]